MASAASGGVVDTDCRVHGVRNLYVVGSSVFCRPTFAPPTMTIVAFALRLAEHLAARLRAR
jgi:choline dehydrogenase-like flavoprotein